MERRTFLEMTGALLAGTGTAYADDEEDVTGPTNGSVVDPIEDGVVDPIENADTEEVEDYVDGEAIAAGEEIDLDDVYMELQYFGKDSDYSHGIAITYPKSRGNTANPGIEKIGAYSISIDDYRGELSRNDSYFESVTPPRNRLDVLLSSDAYQEIIDNGRFTVIQLDPETGDNVHGVFDMAAIDFDEPGWLSDMDAYELKEHEIIRSPKPEGAVTKYLGAVSER